MPGNKTMDPLSSDISRCSLVYHKYFKTAPSEDECSARPSRPTSYNNYVVCIDHHVEGSRCVKAPPGRARLQAKRRLQNNLTKPNGRYPSYYLPGCCPDLDTMPGSVRIARSFERFSIPVPLLHCSCRHNQVDR